MVKDGRAGIGNENPVQHDCVKMRIEPQVRVDSLHDAHRAALTDNALDIAQAALVEPRDRVDGDAGDRAKQLTVVGERAARRER